MSQPPNVLTAADKKDIRDAIERTLFSIKVNKAISQWCTAAMIIVGIVAGWFAGKDMAMDKFEKQAVSIGYGSYTQQGQEMKFQWKDQNVPPVAKP